MFLLSRFATFLVGCCLLMLSPASFAGNFHLDPTLVKGPDACGECHEESVTAWKKSHHSTTFSDLPRSDEAREIANNMGIKRIKSESACLGCHFTVSIEDEKEKPIAGINCESCHSAGKDWIDIHSDFGGKDVKAEDEDPVHKVKRYKDSEKSGMIRPSNLYALAENCYSCHTVPSEKLVNVGGHAAGSKFELVRWSQGEVRHNIWYSNDNTEANIDRRRMLYVVGKMLDLEYSIRGLAKATEKAEFGIAMAKRTKKAIAFINKIGETVDNAQLKEIVNIASGVKIKLNNEAKLLSAADKVSKQAKIFADKNDGSQLSGVDALLPSSDKYKGKVFGG